LCIYNTKTLNKIYGLSLEFGKNWRRPIPNIVEEHFPEISKEERESISCVVKQARATIESYFYDRFDYKDDVAYKNLQTSGYKWIKENYSWMSEENIHHAISQAMYYAWHG
jgi:hypothetical protein